MSHLQILAGFLLYHKVEKETSHWAEFQVTEVLQEVFPHTRQMGPISFTYPEQSRLGQHRIVFPAILGRAFALHESFLSQAIKRFGKPQEIANAVAWLCSDEASLVTGLWMGEKLAVYGSLTNL